MTTDRTNDFKTLSALLNIERDPKDNDISYACNFFLNDYQTLHIRLEGALGGKAYAQIAPNHTIINDIYIDRELRYLSINFSKDKPLESMAKDIKRRLLDNPDTARQLEQTIASHNRHLAYEKKKNRRTDFLKSLGFRTSSNSETATFFERQEDERYLSIKAETARNEFECYGMTDEQFEAVLRLLVSFHQGEE